MTTNRRLLCLTAATACVTTMAISVATSGTAAATQYAAAAANYVVAAPVCATAPIGHARCLAERLVHIGRYQPGARKADEQLGPTTYATGPAGGYTPGDLATAYGVNASAPTVTTVAIVAAYDAPTARADLNTYDTTYGLPAETTTSLQKYSQTGSTTSLPVSNASWAGEVSLDLDAVRGLCHTCRILLVEANSDSDSDLAAAENRAAALGAGVISNSFGEVETGPISPTITAAFNHPGVVTLAGSGDDGWNSWDLANQGTTAPSAPYYPASLSTVVSVGGTTLELNSNGTRAEEAVWNDNGEADLYGSFGLGLGGTGDGCSTEVTAPRWQTALPQWKQTGCGTKRSSADIAAVADPLTGLDVYDTYNAPGWQTVGGTSLATPVIAAIWALSGGSGGVANPALSLYGHANSGTTRPFYDVTSGGNGFCGGLSASTCDAEIGQSPNTLGLGYLDCAYLPNSEQASSGTRGCDATSGYDGPTGVGTPTGLAGFTAMNPTAVLTTLTKVTHNAAASFSSAASTDPFPGGTIAASTWSWGDGTTGAGSTVTHTYTKAGTYTLKLNVTDSYQRSATTTHVVAVT